MADNCNKFVFSDTLTAVISYNSTDYFIYRGNPMGFQLELLKDFASHLGVELKIIVENNFARSLMLLLTGQCDIIAQRNLSGFCNMNMVLYSEPFSYSQLVILQKLGDKSLQSLCNNYKDTFKIAGTIPTMNCLNKSLNSFNCNIVFDKVDSLTSEQIMQYVADGIIPIAVVTEDLALLFSNYYPQLKISEKIGEPIPISWAVKKSSVILCDSINAWINLYKQNGFFEKKYTKYFKHRYGYSGIDYSDYINNKNIISPFDDIIKHYAKSLGWDWRLLASLIYQESKFNPNAISWAGAYGIMQLMPQTAIKFGIDSTANVSDHINAGVKYLKFLDDNIPETVCDSVDRIKMILAAYNVGLSHVIDAIALAEKYGRNPDVWKNNVEIFLISLSDSEFYTDSIVNSGYCPGKLVKAFVDDIFERYEHYLNIIEK